MSRFVERGFIRGFRIFERGKNVGFFERGRLRGQNCCRMDKIVVGWTELNVDKDRIQEALDDAEKNIDLLTIEYDEITKYRTLQKYHDTVDEYLSFANDASYYNIKVMRDSYEERILEIKNELQSVFE